jgi:hypothetical protein
MYVCYVYVEAEMSKADEVIRYARESYVEPAVRHGESVVRIRAGDVHKALQLNNRVPSVCQALTSKRFLDQNNLVLIEKHGPPSGLSTTTVFIYRLENHAQALNSADNSETPGGASSFVLSLRGTGKKLFTQLGGGEKFLTEERERWNTTTAPIPRGKN